MGHGCTEGASLLVCISISPALHHLAVIFSYVKPAGNSRHSFAFFSLPTENPCCGPTLRGRFKDTAGDSFNFRSQDNDYYVRHRRMGSWHLIFVWAHVRVGSSFSSKFTGIWLCVVALCRIYEGLKNCTFQVALRLDCFWPNQIVDRFFMNIHRIYFHDCALTGRLLHDPPIGILAPFIAVPVLVTLLMTALVVWRSKRTEGVL